MEFSCISFFRDDMQTDHMNGGEGGGGVVGDMEAFLVSFT